MIDEPPYFEGFMYGFQLDDFILQDGDSPIYQLPVAVDPEGNEVTIMIDLGSGFGSCECLEFD